MKICDLNFQNKGEVLTFLKMLKKTALLVGWGFPGLLKSNSCGNLKLMSEYLVTEFKTYVNSQI